MQSTLQKENKAAEISRMLENGETIRGVSKALGVPMIDVTAVSRGFSSGAEYRAHLDERRAKALGFKSATDYNRSKREALARKSGFDSYSAYVVHKREQNAKGQGFPSYNEYQMHLLRQKGLNSQYDYRKSLALRVGFGSVNEQRNSAAISLGFPSHRIYQRYMRNKDIADLAFASRSLRPLSVGIVLDYLIENGPSSTKNIARGLQSYLGWQCGSNHVESIINALNSRDNPPWFVVSEYRNNSDHRHISRRRRLVVSVNKHYLGHCEVQLRK